MCFGKAVVRYAVIAGLVGGTAVLIAGPARMGALMSQTRGHINKTIDKHIEDPVALRAQLKSLEGTYPERIASVRGDLAELKEQITQLNRELEVSERVCELSAADMDTMQGLITRAESYRESAGDGNVVRVAFNNESLDLKDAYGKANKIRQVHNAYSTRAADIKRDLGYLNQQEGRLTNLLDQLQTEHAEFQAQMWQLDRQVDSIARNDRMIAMMEKRQRTIDEQSRYSAASLDQVQARFADIRAKQEAKLETLGQSSSGMNYEDRAKFDLDARKSYGPGADAGQDAGQSKPAVAPSLYKRLPKAPKVIEVTPQDLKEQDAPRENVRAVSLRTR